MDNFLYIFNIIVLLVGVYIFLIVFKIYRPKHKTEEQKEKFQEWHIKFGTILKICSIIMIISGLYDIFGGDSFRQQKDSNNHQWTEKQRENMVNGCIQNAKHEGTYYPGLTEEYCKCSVDEMIKVLTLTKYLEMQNNPSKQERSKIIMPIVKDCLKKYNLKVDSILKDTKRLPN